MAALMTATAAAGQQTSFQNCNDYLVNVQCELDVQHSHTRVCNFALFSSTSQAFGAMSKEVLCCHTRK